MGGSLLVFDGDCGFCRYWIARWRARTGNTVEYLPFQDPSVRERLPDILPDEFARAVQFVDEDGSVSSGARAVFQLTERAGTRWPLWAYEHVPGVPAVTERTYRLVADHRSVFSRLTQLLWGSDPASSTYAVGTWLFLRALGLAYLCAFASLAVQVRGLIGREGILPAGEFMAGAAAWATANGFGLSRFAALPTVFWFGASDAVLQGACVAGVALAILLVAGVASVAVVPALWLLYLSLSVVSSDFLSFQWDALLLETGLLAVLVTPFVLLHRPAGHEPRAGARWLVWWLLFRLMLGSGIVKLASGDPTWRGLTALAYHYETQPLPTPLAWFAHQLPGWSQRVSTALVLIVELGAPWLIYSPRRVRTWACAMLILLQVLIAATGNYAFFNLLSIALCLTLVDDATWRSWRSKIQRRNSRPAASIALGRNRGWPSLVVGAAALVIVPASLVMLTAQAGTILPGSSAIAPVLDALAPFRSVNAYGLFAVMTTTRPEIILEGSNDGTTWTAYEFKYQPGDVRRRPPWVAPHQPRLDWQMWFAALGTYENESWFQNFCLRLLEGSPSVRALLGSDPFPDRPPRYVRGVLYQYHFAGRPAHADGIWWVRDRSGAYSPPLSLKSRVDPSIPERDPAPR